MDEEIIRQLLSQTEGTTLDFKQAAYRLDNDHYKAKFLKDIVSMANTPRSETSFIVIGVSKSRGGHRTFHSLSEDDHPDDADLQSLVGSRVSPMPAIRYEVVEFEGNSLGVIAIEAQRGGPYLPTWEPKGGTPLRKGGIYLRRGSQNAEANPEEIRRIVEWMSGNDEREVRMPVPAEPSRWGEFALACHDFDDDWLHVLVMGDTGVSEEALGSLGRIDWSAVVDFDTAGQDGPAYKAMHPELRSSLRVHFLTLADEFEFVPGRAAYWFAARGYRAAPSTLADGDWRAWFLRYDKHLKKTFEMMARGADERPLVLTVLGMAPEFAQSVVEAAFLAFGPSLTVVVGSSRADEYSALRTRFEAQIINISAQEICSRIRDNRGPREVSTAVLRLPGLEGDVAIPADELVWLEEDLELLHLDIGASVDESVDGRREFLRGSAISWVQLAMHCDVDRDATSTVVEQISADLASRRTSRVNIFHWPGSGGTTIGRRVAWEMHRRFPVVELRRLRGEETFGRIRTIFDRTKLAPLVLVDASVVQLNELEQLYANCRSRQLPLVFLIVMRRREERANVPASSSERSVFIQRSLPLAEAARFAKVYGDEEPNRRSSLQALAEEKNERLRNPFYFGLVAFEANFLGLEPYVDSRLASASEIQRKILIYLSLAYYYSQRSLPAQFFVELLAARPTSPVRISDILAGTSLDLVMREGRFNWRPAHDLVAEEILEAALSGNAVDRRVWKNNLAAWAISFAEIAAAHTAVISDDLMDTIRRVFVLRDSEELLGRTTASRLYSRLIEDIPTNEGRLGVLKRLVELFPGEAHFWGHLGRLYSQALRQYDDAIETLDHAIRLAEWDDVLHHMKGMALRHQAYDLIQSSVRDEDHGLAHEETIHMLAERAGEEFRLARELAPTDEHGYIAQIQLCVSMIEYGARVAQAESIQAFLPAPKAEWYRERLDEAEQLLETVERISEGQHQSRFYVGCRAGVDELYGNYAQVLKAWTALLDRNDLYLPPVRRQVARTFVRQSTKNGVALKQDELHRILRLMEENRLQEPANPANLKLWFRAARHIPGYSIDKAIEGVSSWRAVSDSVDATFYLYVLHVLKAMDGSEVSRWVAEDLLKECRQKSLALKNRHYALEWIGHGNGLERLVESRQLGEWEEEFADPHHLVRLEGVIRDVKPGSGFVELPWGLQAFFNPTRRSGESFLPGRDLNRSISFYLAFAYDNLRAWDPRSLDE